MRKHGIYMAEKQEDVYELYWMGDRVSDSDFNERLIGMTRSVGEQIDMFVQGFEAKESLNEGQKTVAQLNELEKVARLPLCKDCRKLIGEAPQ
jgi:hypothetical protein